MVKISYFHYNVVISWVLVIRHQYKDSADNFWFCGDRFLPLGLSGRRSIVVACICPLLHLSICLWTLPFPHLNWSQIWVGITKFAANMHHGIPSVDIENRDHWPWPSRSFCPFRLRILGNSVGPCNNSSKICAIITKFAPNMHPGIL